MSEYKKYPLMFSPYRLPNGVLLKSRLEATPSGQHFIQGPEPYPTHAAIADYASKARNGAAIVVVSYLEKLARTIDGGHARTYDIKDGRNQHYLSQLVNAIQCYNSKALTRFDIDGYMGSEYDVSTGVPTAWVYGDGTYPLYDRIEVPRDVLLKTLDEYIEGVYSLKRDMGFDGIWLHMSYRHHWLGRFISPLTNKRTDEFGGETAETRFAFPLLVAQRIKDRCGKSFIVEGSISGHDPLDEDGNKLEDVIKMAHMAEGAFDILTVKGPWIDESHPTQFDEEVPWRYMSEAIKASNPKVAISNNGGYLYPDTVEETLRNGQADLIGMARTWISNPNYGELVQSGRTDDIVPCLKCNKCHKSSDADPWITTCSVNPTYGMEYILDKLVKPSEGGKKVAVIGGGPGGMETALAAAERGHRVTLFEKQDHLGGQTAVTKDVPFKWTLQDYRRYQIHQIEKSAVDVRLGCCPDPGELAKENYDVVVAAVGAAPAIPPIPGVDGANVTTAVDAFVSPDSVQGDVVVIGGGEIGVECGMYFAKLGHKVTVLEMLDKPAPDATPVHYYKMFRDQWEKLENLSILCNATVSGIEAGKVCYTDKDGAAQEVPAQSVILAAGMKSLDEEALRYANAGGRFYMVGDCNKVGNLQKVLRSAYMCASQF